MRIQNAPFSWQRSLIHEDATRLKSLRLAMSLFIWYTLPRWNKLEIIFGLSDRRSSGGQQQQQQQHIYHLFCRCRKDMQLYTNALTLLTGLLRSALLPIQSLRLFRALEYPYRRYLATSIKGGKCCWYPYRAPYHGRVLNEHVRSAAEFDAGWLCAF